MYSISCLLASQSFPILTSCVHQPAQHALGIYYMLFGVGIRFIALILAYTQGMHFIYVVIGLILPTAILFLLQKFEDFYWELSTKK